jgi:hypothetical protein
MQCFVSEAGGHQKPHLQVTTDALGMELLEGMLYQHNTLIPGSTPVLSKGQAMWVQAVAEQLLWPHFQLPEHRSPHCGRRMANKLRISFA